MARNYYYIYISEIGLGLIFGEVWKHHIKSDGVQMLPDCIK